MVFLVCKSVSMSVKYLWLPRVCVSVGFFHCQSVLYPSVCLSFLYDCVVCSLPICVYVCLYVALSVGLHVCLFPHLPRSFPCLLSSWSCLLSVSPRVFYRLS